MSPAPLIGREHRLGAAAFAASAVALSADAAGPLPLQVEKQGGDNWCWAAVALGVARLFGRQVEVRQCSFASRILGMPTADHCCLGARPGRECDIPYSIDHALYEVECWRGGTEQPVAFERIQEEIAAGQPVCVRLLRPDGGAHYVAISGCRRAGGEEKVTVVDPAWPSVGEMRLDELRHSPAGIWTKAIFTQRPPLQGQT